MYAAVVAGAIFLAGVIWWTQANKPSGTPIDTVATSTDSTSSPQAATSSASTPTPTPTPSSPVVAQKPKPVPAAPSPAFSLVQGEAVASWDFVGTHNDNGQLEAKVRADIERLKGLLNSGKYTNYELYVSIANQYELLGDGKQEYTYLSHALAIDSTKTGLAWHNMGKLLEKLGAYKSARVAYDRLIQVQPTTQYLRARLEFLKAHAPEDTDAIKRAEADLSVSTW